MKFKFDLLPNEYKSLPRDTLGIILAVLTIIGSLSAITSMHYKNRGERQQVEAQIKGVEAELRKVIADTSNLQPPLNDINALKGSINFINTRLDTPGTSLVDFLAAFEATIPSNVVVLDLNPKSFTAVVRNFSITGEAPSVFDVTEFVRRMNASEQFNAFLRSNSTEMRGDKSVTVFSVEFTYNPKK